MAWGLGALTMFTSLHQTLGARSYTQDFNVHASNTNQTTETVCPHSLPDLVHFGEDVANQCRTSQFGTLFVGCVSATGLTQKHWYRDNRALCRVEMVSKTRTRESPGGAKPARVGKVFETSVVKGEDPEWKKAFHYEFACVEAAKEMKDYMLQVQIKDRGMLFGTKSHMGYAYVDFDQFDDFSKGTSEWYDLQGNMARGADERTTTAEGKVKIALKWCPFEDSQCLSDAAESEGLSLAGTDWNDCHDGCHNALVEKLGPIYKNARHHMVTAVQAGKDEDKFDDIEDEYEDKAKELEEWLEHHPIDEHMKYWRRPAPPACPPGHGGPEQPACPVAPPLTPEQEFALTWQAKKQEFEHNERQHKEWKRREEEAKKKAKAAFDAGKKAMNTISDELVKGAHTACGKLVVPFVQDATGKIDKMPDGKFKIEKAEQAVRQLEAVWKAILEFKDCLFSKWKHGDLLPSREIETLDAQCYEAMDN